MTGSLAQRQQLSAAELAVATSITLQEAEVLVRQHDTDGDGMLNATEFEAVKTQVVLANAHSHSLQQRGAQPSLSDLEEIERTKSGHNLYTAITIDAKLKPYCPILVSCDFDATQFVEPRDLEQFVLFALDECGLIADLQLNGSKLSHFVHSVATLYRDNPFHNWQHGFFVFHFVLYSVKQNGNIMSILSKQQVLAVLIAALCHDVDHPGNDNLYEIEADTDLARIYNGLSVLENHHTYTTLMLLRKPELDFFEGSVLSKQEVKEMKQVITKSIMATDMAHHGEAVEWLNDFVTEKVVEE